MKRILKKRYIFIIILLISIGFAYLTSNLSLSGISSIFGNTWDVHFENIEISDGSVQANTPVISNNDTTVTFTVVLDMPGDFYEFTVDAVNDGTIDAMLDTFTSTTLTADQLKYLEYTVTYIDGEALAQYQELNSSDDLTYKIRLEYKKNIEITDLPDEDKTIEISFTSNFIQADSNRISRRASNSLYNVLKQEAENEVYAREYNGNHHDSYTKEPSKVIYHWYGRSNGNSNTILNKNNVIFAGFCWQMIRTTDTGGVKMIYNGVPSNGSCNNTGIDQQIGKSEVNSSFKSPAYVGYMYNPNTLIAYVLNSQGSAISGSIFGNGVTYDGTKYTLTNTSTTYDSTHHYTCNNDIGTCSSVRYYYYDNYFMEINDGRTIEECLEDMLSSDDVNNTNSILKSYIENWYETNMVNYTNYLEDTIYCFDRSISDYAGWNPNGESISDTLKFKNYYANGDLTCTNETDKFSVSNSKAKLKYPIGLLTKPEAYILNNITLIKTGEGYWLASPHVFSDYMAGLGYVYTSGSISNGSASVTGESGVRPVISLKKGSSYTSGNGSKESPYVVTTN